MKQLSIILVAMLFIVVVNAQKRTIFNENVTVKKTDKTLKSTNETIFVQDSTKHFSYISADDVWEAQYRNVFTERYPNGNVKYTVRADSTATGWVNKTQIFNTYHSNGNVAIGLTRPWNSNFLAWDTDTLEFLKLTTYFNSEWRGFVLEDKYINKNYDFDTNQYTGGAKWNITLVNDSLYGLFEVSVWDNVANAWGNIVMREELTYDVDGNMTMDKLMEWDDVNSVFVNTDQYLYAYSNGDRIQEIYQVWDGSAWENDYKDVYTYDANHNQLSVTFYNWSSSSWVESSKYTYLYDSNNNKTQEIYAIWNTTDNEWVNWQKYTYNYDVNNLLLNRTKYYWNTTDSEWNPLRQYIYEYNAEGSTTKYTEKNWNSVDLTWKNYTQTVSTYNANNSLTEELNQDWDNVGLVWENDDKTTYTYDANDNKTQQLSQFWSNGDSEWKNSNKDEYYWSSFEAVGVKDIVNNNFKVYPNPTTGVVNISCNNKNIKTVKVTNLLGQEILKTNNSVYRNETINLKEFGTGVYIINVTNTNNEKYSSRVIVK